MWKIKEGQLLKKILLPLSVLAIMFVPFVSALADSVSGDNVIIESNQTLEKTSFLSGGNVRVDGDINGTTFITASTIEVNGTIDGDLFITAQSATINGMVKGSIFLATQDATLKGVIENNVYSVGQNLKVQAKTTGSAFIAGENIFIEGDAEIERDVFVGASVLYQNGIINGDLKSTSESLTVGGKIGGNLNYRSEQQADFSNTSEVIGETTWKKIETQSSEDLRSMFITARLTRALLSLVAAILVWLFVRWMSPSFWQNLAGQILDNPIQTIGFGALAVVFIPIISILLMFTVIGIPLSLIMLALYSITIYSSKIIVSVYVSQFFRNRFDWSDVQAFWLFLGALILLAGLGVIPIVGRLVGFITISLGIGAVGSTIMERKKKIRAE